MTNFQFLFFLDIFIRQHKRFEHQHERSDFFFHLLDDLQFCIFPFVTCLTSSQHRSALLDRFCVIIITKEDLHSSSIVHFSVRASANIGLLPQ